MASELISDLQHTGLVQEVACWFQYWKIQNALFEQRNNAGAIDVKIGRSVFEKKNCLLRCWGCLSLLNWISALTLSLLLKLPSRKSDSWFVLWSFFLPRLLCIFINLPYGPAWNTVVGWAVLVLYVWAGAPSCYKGMLDKLQKWIYRIGGYHIGFLPLSNPWLIIGLYSA